jgi:MtN3 and saliva related transmembrane protein
MDLANLIGMTAGGLTTASFVPQLLKTWRRKSADDISYGMFLLFAAGVSLWLCYGVLIGSAPVMIANAVTLGLALGIVVLKARFDRRSQLNANRPVASER